VAGNNPLGGSAVCTVIAGPNGSGKSSISRDLKPPGRFINADIVARRLDPSNPEGASFAAGKLVLHDLAKTIEAREDFVYETTLSSHQSIELIRRVRDAGYEVGLVFVALQDASLNVARVAQRVSEGGHDIPEAAVRRRYDSSMSRLVDAIRLVHGALIYDNSSIAGPELLLQIANNGVEVNRLDKAKPRHARLAAIVSEALDVSYETVLQAASR
jgi:predicted ABC-type ATPase